MSGIVGIINLDGAPVDRDLLWRMTDFMSFRGPDAQEVWISGNVGLGHTMLRTTFESETEQQPLSLDGDVWLTADARVDGRADLINELESKGRPDLKGANDADLILHAYHAWGEDCVKHLIGDFAFAIWDKRERRLFCARDHFGVKPFYYARLVNCFVLSNTLNCVRVHPDVQAELNEQAIGDFLLFGYNQEPSTTAFAEIRRLPPATSLTVAGGDLRCKRYWLLAEGPQIRFKKAHQYIGQFNELFGASIRDRLRTDHLAVWMSGGLDSTSIAVCAHQALSRESRSFDLRAHTEVYEWLFDDDERQYAELVANSLGIPIRLQKLDQYAPFDGWELPEFHWPEPFELCMMASEIDEIRNITSYSRVVLCGYGGDPAFVQTAVPHLIGHMPTTHLLLDIARLVFAFRRIPPSGVRSGLKNWVQRQSVRPKYPTWLSKAFSERTSLPKRWEQLNRRLSQCQTPRHRACNLFASPFWTYRFETHDPGFTTLPVEARYPFFDRRLLEYLLAVPPLPWCVDKILLREAMRGLLPEPVRVRPKTYLAADPINECLKHSRAQRFQKLALTPALGEYVDTPALPQLIGDGDPLQLWSNVRALCLNYWLQYAKQPIVNDSRRGEFYELQK